MAESGETLVDSLTERIRRRIQKGKYADGALFMTEAQLAAEYEVSRTVAREAVSRLSALGIVEGRQRKGLMIRRPDPLRLFSESLPSLSSTNDLRELGQLRYVLEVGAVELSVRNATDDQIKRMGEVVEAMTTALGQQVSGGKSMGKRFVALDLQFHALLLEMTGSTLVAGMQQVLVRFFAAVPYIDPDESSTDRILWEHRELYAAVRDRDVERARSMIRSQLRRRLPEGADHQETHTQETAK
jgi:GntR family transcriptional regulator, transcriptional repressor for pyruvate dehydrogenase complex